MLPLRFFGLAVCVTLIISAPVVAEESLHWESNLEVAKQLAAKTNRLVLIHFGAPSCGGCRKLEEQVFSQPGFGKELMANFVAVKVNTDLAPSFARQYGIEVIPADAVITPQGQMVQKLKSPFSVADYVTAMNRIAAGAKAAMAVAAKATGPSRQSTSQGTPSQPAATADLRGSVGSDDRYADYYNRRNASSARATDVQALDTSVPAGPGQSVYDDDSQPPDSDDQAAREPVDRHLPVDRQVVDERYAEHPVDVQPAQELSQPTDQNTASVTDVVADRSLEEATMAQAADGHVTSQSVPPANVQQSQPINPQLAAHPTEVVTERPKFRLPPGSYPLALDGYCPVTLVKTKKVWKMGDVRYGAYHRGRTYLFAGPEEQRAFLADPDYYAPAISGNDPVLAVDFNRSVPGRREFGCFLDNQIYLFANHESLKQFEAHTEQYALEVRQATAGRKPDRR